MHSSYYERLFLLNRCLEQASEILKQLQQEGVIHAEFAGHRRKTVEDLRADLSYVVTGMFHRRELEECVGFAQTEPERNEGLGQFPAK